jgi:citrate synthase
MNDEVPKRSLPPTAEAPFRLGGSRRISAVEEMYLSADAAAAELGVTMPTFYSYVSRRPVRSTPVSGSRRRLYWRPDIEALRRGEADSLARRIALTSSITLVTAQGPFYRGTSAIELSRTETLETAASLLWSVPQDEAFGAAPCAIAPTLTEALVAGTDGSTDACCIIMALLDKADRRAFDFSQLGFARTSANALRWAVATAIGARAPSDEPLHEFIGRQLRIGGELTDLVRRLLVLSADHGVTTSAAAVRCVAARGVSPYRLAAVGLIASTGRRLPFGQVSTLSQMVDELLDSSEPADTVMRQLKEGIRLPGFGTGAYGDSSDPRADELLDVLGQGIGNERSVKKILRACSTIKELTGMHPDFALIVVFIARLAGLPTSHRMLIHFARIAGWEAHGFEEFRETDPLRVGEYYTGPLPRLEKAAPSVSK